MKKLIILFMAATVSMTGFSNKATSMEQIPGSKLKIEVANLKKNTQAANHCHLSGSVSVIKCSVANGLKATYEGFQSPTGIALDNDGNLYVSNWSGGTVTKIDTHGKSSVFADGMSSPAGLAFDEFGNLYISDYSKNVIYKVTPNGVKTTFAQGFHTPTGIAFNRAGELLVTNRGSDEIVKVGISGKIELVAKGMRTPVGVVEDKDGNLYVTNYGGGIIKVTKDGVTSTVSDKFGRPGVGIGINNENTVFAADNGDNCVRMIAQDGTTEVVVGDIGGCVALLVHEDTLYVGSWDSNAVYAYSLSEK